MNSHWYHDIAECITINETKCNLQSMISFSHKFSRPCKARQHGSDGTDSSTHSSMDPPTSSSLGASSSDVIPVVAAGAAGSSASMDKPRAIILLIRWAKS